MSDIYSVFAAIVALGAPVASGPVGFVEAAPALVLNEPNGSNALDVRYRDGEIAGEIPATRFTVAHDQLPPRFFDALVSVEDAAFFEHAGIDPTGIARASLGVLLPGAARGGGSTITQQLAKNVVTGADATVARKIAEAISAVQTEAIASKEEILESYANAVYFGRRSNGAAHAAENWFGKAWAELNTQELAFLAGVLRAPSGLDPERNPSGALNRRDYVLARMEAEGRLTTSERSAAAAEPLIAPGRPVRTFAPSQLDDAQFWAVSMAAQQRDDVGGSLTLSLEADIQRLAQSQLDSGLLDLRSVHPDDPLGSVLTSGLESADMSTTSLGDLASAMARAAPTIPNDSVRVVVSSVGDLRDANGNVVPGAVPNNAVEGDVYVQLSENGATVGRPSVQGAIVVVDIVSGEVIASIGGTDTWASQFDRTRAMRQPGSAIKPFLYLAALERGVGPHDRLSDSAQSMQDGESVWSPTNYGGQSRGSVAVFEALEGSLNLATIDLARRIGQQEFQTILERAGAYPAGTNALRLPSAVLGTVATTPFNMANAMARLVPGHSAIASQENLESLEAMMRGVVSRGTAAVAFAQGPEGVVGKTGTSQDFRDAWFIGRTGDIALAVWIGRDDDRPMQAVNGRNVTGGAFAAPIAAAIFEELQSSGRSVSGAVANPFDRGPSLSAPIATITAGEPATTQAVEAPGQAPPPFQVREDLVVQPPPTPRSSAGREGVNPLPSELFGPNP